MHAAFALDTPSPDMGEGARSLGGYPLRGYSPYRSRR